jgi:hypothetical protein
MSVFSPNPTAFVKRFSTVFSTLFASFALAIILSGCSSVYMPNVPNTPMLTAKGELNTGGHITLRSNASFNSAYAVSDHVGLLVNGSMMSSNRVKKDFRHNLLEAGAGYFTTFGGGKRVLEIYGGFGRGSSDRTYKEKTPEGVNTYDRQEVTFNKYFVQVNYSSKDQKSLKLFGRVYPLNYGTALRASYLNMDEFFRNDLEQPTEDNIFLEPIFFTRLVLSPAVQLQYTSGFNFGLKNRKFLTAGNSVSSVGFVINVGGRNLNRKRPQ